MPRDCRSIIVFGSTGSIGTQTLDVVRSHPELFIVNGLTCGKNIPLLRQQIQEFQPKFAVTQEKEDAEILSAEFPRVSFYYGEQGLIEAAQQEADLVVNALMGMRGMVPTYHAMKSGHDVALANKETLVAGGHVIMKTARECGIQLLPVDSEHSAIFQSMQSSPGQKIRRILLTASGGPFRGWTKEKLAGVTPEMALAHPNWSMGRKITIDSATMMNKGLEMIEAKWLFDVDIRDIQVLVHPQSILHSAVEFEDTAVIGQLGAPDMRVPIAVAMGFPERLSLDVSPLDFFGKAANLTFEKPDPEVFECLTIAKEASLQGGAKPIIMNGANEVLVQAFLDKKIGFLDIPAGVKRAMEEDPYGKSMTEPTLEEIVEIDRETREKIEREILC